MIVIVVGTFAVEPEVVYKHRRTIWPLHSGCLCSAMSIGGTGGRWRFGQWGLECLAGTTHSSKSWGHGAMGPMSSLNNCVVFLVRLLTFLNCFVAPGKWEGTGHDEYPVGLEKQPACCLYNLWFPWDSCFLPGQGRPWVHLSLPHDQFSCLRNSAFHDQLDLESWPWLGWFFIW